MFVFVDWFLLVDIEFFIIEIVEFFDRKIYKSLELVFIFLILFLEVMCDIDFVVSVVYVGGVDFEISYFIVEMCIVIVKEFLLLLKINNVNFEGFYVFIVGNLGEYFVYMGFGIVYKKGMGVLNIFFIYF